MVLGDSPRGDAYRTVRDRVVDGEGCHAVVVTIIHGRCGIFISRPADDAARSGNRRNRRTADKHRRFQIDCLIRRHGRVAREVGGADPVMIYLPCASDPVGSVTACSVTSDALAGIGKAEPYAVVVP